MGKKKTGANLSVQAKYASTPLGKLETKLNGALPMVSVVTVTYNRRPFIQFMRRCFDHQTYPKDRMEWIIVDDGSSDGTSAMIKKNYPNDNIIVQTRSELDLLDQSKTLNFFDKNVLTHNYNLNLPYNIFVLYTFLTTYLLFFLHIHCLCIFHLLIYFQYFLQIFRF